MKPFLFLLLFSLICCRNPLDLIQCLTKDGIIVDRVFKIIELVKSKDFEKLVPTVIEAFFTIKDLVTTCFTENDEPVLKINESKTQNNPLELKKCLMQCGDFFYDIECHQKCFDLYGGDFEYPLLKLK